ncbi:MAG TPA: hypothetical protein VL943_08015 [Niabella sp.]|nr:hypothetical protein [Niabella sp.]
MSNAKIPAIIQNINNYFLQNAGLFLLMEKAEGVNAGKDEVLELNTAAEKEVDSVETERLTIE